MILNTSQAQAVAKTIAEMNNLGASRLSMTFGPEGARTYVVATPTTVTVSGPCYRDEYFLSQQEFFTAYSV